VVDLVKDEQGPRWNPRTVYSCRGSKEGRQSVVKDQGARGGNRALARRSPGVVVGIVGGTRRFAVGASENAPLVFLQLAPSEPYVICCDRLQGLAIIVMSPYGQQEVARQEMQRSVVVILRSGVPRPAANGGLGGAQTRAPDPNHEIDGPNTGASASMIRPDRSALVASRTARSPVFPNPSLHG
jgi:hypothetical protein